MGLVIINIADIRGVRFICKTGVQWNYGPSRTIMSSMAKPLKVTSDP